MYRFRPYAQRGDRWHSVLCRASWLAAIMLGLLLTDRAPAQVGFAQFHSGNLPVTVVYATDAVATSQQFGPFDIKVAVDAVPAAGNGRLVVVSHGSGGDAFTLHTLARTLALAGFVVAQPEHQGDNWQDRSDSGPVSWQRRPGEIAATIDAIQADPRFAAALRFDKVGVYGVSAGGGTGLILAGADWSEWSYQQHCAAHVHDDAGFCLYGLQTEMQREARAKLYLEVPTEGSEKMLAGPAAMDHRIAAVVVSVPVGAIFTAASLAAIHMPVGVVEAQADKVLNPVYHSARVLSLCTACIRLDSVIGGGHFDTLSPWPEGVATAAAAAPGAQRNLAIDDARRQISYDRIAAFFVVHLAR